MLAPNDGLAPAAPSAWSAPAAARRFVIAVERREDDIALRVARAVRQGAATVFQSEAWLRSWYATIGRVAGEPLLLSAIDGNSGNLSAILPLVKRTDGRLRVVEFADLGVSDSNAPILGPSAPTEAADARVMWKAMRVALADADLVRFTKMPPTIRGRVNPLTLLPSVRMSSNSGNVVVIEGSWKLYLANLKRKVRKELGRSWRVFTQHEGAKFCRIDQPDHAIEILTTLERQQGERLRAQGQPYQLDEPAFSAFYRQIATEGIADGSVILTALMHHDEVVSALLSLVDGMSCVMVRISAGADEWSNCSPGRLVITQTMQMLHAEGFHTFDFSIGDYPYKRRLGAHGHPLFDLTETLTPRGLPMLAYDRTKQFVRRHPTMHALARRIVQPGRRAEPETTGDDRA